MRGGENMASFGNKLRREFLRNPKKGAALGGLCLVALWFWAPLVKDWIAPAAKQPLPPAKPAIATTGGGASPAAVPVAGHGPTLAPTGAASAHFAPANAAPANAAAAPFAAAAGQP